MKENLNQKPRKKVQVVVIAQTEVLLLEFNTNERHNYHGFQNITGGVENDETYAQAAKRELFEETGVEADVVELELEFHFVDRWEHAVTEKVFLCVLDKKPLVKISEEHQSYKWVPVKQVQITDFLFASNFESFEKARDFMEEIK